MYPVLRPRRGVPLQYPTAAAMVMVDFVDLIVKCLSDLRLSTPRSSLPGRYGVEAEDRTLPGCGRPATSEWL